MGLFSWFILQVSTPMGHGATRDGDWICVLQGVGRSIYIYSRPFRCRMEGRWEKTGVGCQLMEEGCPKDVGQAELKECMSLHIWNTSTVPWCTTACQSGNSRPTIFYFRYFDFWSPSHCHSWEPLSILWNRWVPCGCVCSLDHCFLSRVGTVASPALSSQPAFPLFVHQTCCASDACLTASKFSTLCERILFVFRKFEWKQTQANTPKERHMTWEF